MENNQITIEFLIKLRLELLNKIESIDCVIKIFQEESNIQQQIIQVEKINYISCNEIQNYIIEIANSQKTFTKKYIKQYFKNKNVLAHRVDQAFITLKKNNKIKVTNRGIYSLK